MIALFGAGASTQKAPGKLPACWPRMTRDRYTVSAAVLPGTLLVEQEDGSVKQPDQLSRASGREQLYLADPSGLRSALQPQR